jgi:hypothetical protein
MGELEPGDGLGSKRRKLNNNDYDDYDDEEEQDEEEDDEEDYQNYNKPSKSSKPTTKPQIPTKFPQDEDEDLVQSDDEQA